MVLQLALVCKKLRLALGAADLGEPENIAASVGMGWSSVSERLQTGRPTKSGYLFKYTKKAGKAENVEK